MGPTNTGSAVIELYTIYAHPSDYPNNFVVRVFLNDEAGPVHAVVKNLLEARKSIPPGKVRMERDAFDDPVIVETWL